MFTSLRKSLKPIRRMRNRWVLSRLAGGTLLREYAKAHPRAVFVQVGSNDGQMMDPIRQVILHSEWRGLVIEPVPCLFKQLRLNYRQTGERVTAVNVAISDSDNPATFYHLQQVDGLPALPDWAQGLGTFRKEIILKHADRISHFERYLTSITVPCLTLTSVCRRYGLKRMDVLAVDTEGYDFEIIRQVDFERMAPDVIVYEHHHLSKGTRQVCHDMLRQQGYWMLEEGLDTWCLRASQHHLAELVKQWPRWIRRSRYAMAVNSERALDAE